MKYHSKADVITQARAMGSTAKTYRGARKYILCNTREFNAKRPQLADYIRIDVAAWNSHLLERRADRAARHFGVRSREPQMRAAERRQKNRYARVLDLAKDCGITAGKFSSDTIMVIVQDLIYRQADLRRYHAAGPMLAVVDMDRTRTYAKSSGWRPSRRLDTFLVGQNEDGSAFAHQVSSTIGTVAEAWGWIWGGAEVIARQGDVAITHSNLKHVIGELSDIPVAGHSSHRVVGEIYRNGALHVRDAVIFHDRAEHPPIWVSHKKWHRVVFARRSTAGLGTAD